MPPSFQESLREFIDSFTDEHPDTPLEEVIAALEARAFIIRQEITAAVNPGAN